MVEEEKLINEANELFSERMSKELIGAVYRAVGLVSVCWSNIDGAGTFDTKEAEDIAVDLCRMIAEEMEAGRDAICGYLETTTKRKHFDSCEGDIR
jgi:hypothetical protein